MRRHPTFRASCEPDGARPPAGARTVRARARSRRLGPMVAALALACLVVVPAGGRAAGGGSAVAGVRAVGSLPRPPGCGIDRYAVDPGLGVLVDIHQLGGASCTGTATGTFVTTYSTSSLRQLSPLVPLTSARSGSPDVSLDVQPVVDGVHHRLYVATNGTTGVGPMYVYDIAALVGARGPVVAPKTYTLPQKPPASASGSGGDPAGTIGDAASNLVINALAYDAASDSLDAILANPGTTTSTNSPGSAYDVYLDELSGSTGAQRWLVRLGSCVIPLHSANVNSQGAVLHLHQGGEQVAVTCAYVNPLAVADAGSTNFSTGIAVTVLVPLSGGRPAGAQQSFLGRAGTLGAIADPAASRLLYATEPATSGGTGANAAGPSVVAFDVPHRAYIGATTASSAAAATTGFAVAVAGSRLYAAGPEGIVVADDTATPTDPGLVYPVFTGFAQGLVVDPATHRLFVIPESCSAGTCNVEFTSVPVFQDDSQILPLSAVDVDASTHDVAEQAGKTQTTFSGRAFGTAVRSRLVGGITTFLDGLTVEDWSFLVYSCLTNVPCPGGHVPPDFVTHEVDYGTVTDAALDNVQANATASTVVTDDATAGTLKRDANIQRPKPAACSAPVTPSGSVSWSPTSAPTGSDVAAVTCLRGQAVKATSTVGAVGYSAKGAGTLVSMGNGSVVASVVRDPGLGLVATTTSTVDGIAVGPVRIGNVTAVSVCQAHGRPRTASCTYTRTISAVTVNGAAVGRGACSEKDPSPTGAQDCQRLVAELNTLRPGLLIFSAPEPESSTPGTIHGSPGGYQAITQRGLYEHLQDSVLNYDDSLTVPGLEILDVNDTQSAPSRLDIQVASVESDSHYGIHPAFDLALPPPPSVPSVPTVLATSGSLPSVISPSGTSRLGPGLGGDTGTVPRNGGGRTGLFGLVTSIVDGIKVLARSPGTALLVALLLCLLGAPAVVTWRRGRLLAALSAGGS